MGGQLSQVRECEVESNDPKASELDSSVKLERARRDVTKWMEHVQELECSLEMKMQEAADTDRQRAQQEDKVRIPLPWREEAANRDVQPRSMSISLEMKKQEAADTDRQRAQQEDKVRIPLPWREEAANRDVQPRSMSMLLERDDEKEEILQLHK